MIAQTANTQDHSSTLPAFAVGTAPIAAARATHTPALDARSRPSTGFAQKHSSVRSTLRSSSFVPSQSQFYRPSVQYSQAQLPEFTVLASADAASIFEQGVTEKEVLDAQKLWADSIVEISSVYANKGDFIAAAADAAGKLYAYGHGNVLFKPTKATKHPFRPKPEQAMSYFVGAEAMKNEEFLGEDGGFAINGGRGWKKVEFRNHQIEVTRSVAIAMGEYWFTDATSEDVVRVEYTFGYKRCEDGKVRICLHHSSAPYEPPVTETEVLSAQKLWAHSIVKISDVYKSKGDYVAAAAEAAGELYGYGHTNVLFKPTKATKHPFRPTGEDAMSYFVGADVMKMDQYKGEDAGFAINGGRGWSNVVFNNFKIDLNGPTAQAMGSYTFTDATSGDNVVVEYTFGYKRNDDGKVRIYLHHSSVPYSA